MRHRVYKVTFSIFLWVFLLVGFAQAQEPQENKPDTTVSNYWKASLLNNDPLWKTDVAGWQADLVEQRWRDAQMESLDIPKFRWTEEYTTMGKIQAAVTFSWLYMFLRRLKFDEGTSIVTSTLSAVMLEYTDATNPREVYWWGGKGWSWDRLACSVGGILFVHYVKF